MCQMSSDEGRAEKAIIDVYGIPFGTMYLSAFIVKSTTIYVNKAK